MLRNGLFGLGFVLATCTAFVIGRRSARDLSSERLREGSSHAIETAEFEPTDDLWNASERHPAASDARGDAAIVAAAQEVTPTADQLQTKEKSATTTIEPGKLMRAADYIASAEFNPSGKEFQRDALIELDNLISRTRSELRYLDLVGDKAYDDAVSQKIASGDYRSLAVGEPAGHDPDAIASTLSVSGDGIKAVSVFVGDSLELDDFGSKKSALLDKSAADIRAWIASH